MLKNVVKFFTNYISIPWVILIGFVFLGVESLTGIGFFSTMAGITFLTAGVAMILFLVDFVFKKKTLDKQNRM